MVWLLHCTDNEYWNLLDEFETKEEAIKAGRENFEELYEEETGGKFDPNYQSKTFYVGERQEFIPYVVGDYVIDNLIDQAGDEGGEFAEGYLEDATKEQIDELSNKFTEVFNKWAKKYNHQPHFYTIAHEKKIELDE